MSRSLGSDEAHPTGQVGHSDAQREQVASRGPKPSRPALRYHGGKWRLAPWIISHMPAHRVYVEPFGGAASVLIRKPRVYAEVYNDLDGEIVNLFSVLRDRESARELIRLVELTPFARTEFEIAYQKSDDLIEQARRTLIKSGMGFGSAAVTQDSPTAAGGGWRATTPTGFRCDATRSGTTPALDWRNYPAGLPALIERMQGVVMECRTFDVVMRTHDGPNTLHYCDPPYVHQTRGQRQWRYCRSYRHEMTNAEHEAFAEVAQSMAGMVMVSGYRCDLYDSLFRGWERAERATHADGARDRMESLWLNSAASDKAQLSLMDVSA